MLYLILAVASSTLITVLMRISAGKSKNELSLLSMNYLACLTLSFLFMENKHPFPAEEGLSTALILGVIGGFLYLGSFLLLKWNVNKNGVTLPATFMKLGVLVPTVLSAMVFHEKMHLTTYLGILLALTAILMLKEKSTEKARNTAGLLLLLAGGGMADAMSKIFDETAPASLSDHYLFYIFFVAFVLCLILVWIKRQRYTRWDVLFGLLIGIPNYFSSRFLLAALADGVPAVVAYPSFSAGTIVLTALAGAVMFRERFTRKKLLALLIILGALALLNLPG